MGDWIGKRVDRSFYLNLQSVRQKSKKTRINVCALLPRLFNPLLRPNLNWEFLCRLDPSLHMLILPLLSPILSFVLVYFHDLPQWRSLIIGVISSPMARSPTRRLSWESSMLIWIQILWLDLLSAPIVLVWAMVAQPSSQGFDAFVVSSLVIREGFVGGPQGPFGDGCLRLLLLIVSPKLSGGLKHRSKLSRHELNIQSPRSEGYLLLAITIAASILVLTF
jgi:hypothetical protein